MENNKRKIIKKQQLAGSDNKCYESLKPIISETGSEDWEKNGRKYDLRGIDNLLRGDNNLKFVLEPEVQEDLSEYRINQRQKSILYSDRKNNLESKTI